MGVDGGVLEGGGKDDEDVTFESSETLAWSSCIEAWI